MYGAMSQWYATKLPENKTMNYAVVKCCVCWYIYIYIYIHKLYILKNSFIYAKNLEKLSYQLLSQISSHQYWENKADTAQCLPSRLNKIIVMSYHFIHFMDSSLMTEFGVYILLFGGIFTGIRNMMGSSWFSEVDVFLRTGLTKRRVVSKPSFFGGAMLVLRSVLKW